MIYEINDIVMLEDHRETELFYKVLDVWENGQPKKVGAINADGVPVLFKGKEQLTYTSKSPKEWQHIKWHIQYKGDMPKYFKVIRKIKQLDERFENRKGVTA